MPFVAKGGLGKAQQPYPLLPPIYLTHVVHDCTNVSIFILGNDVWVWYVGVSKHNNKYNYHRYT